MDDVVSGEAAEAIPNLPAVIERTLGSEPLRNPRHEDYAKARAMALPPAAAYRLAGFQERRRKADEDRKVDDISAARGNAAKLERSKFGPAIAARIAYLSRQDEELWRAKRNRLEEFLWSIHESNVAHLWEVAERPKLDHEGDVVLDKETGEPVMVKYQRPKLISELPEDTQRLIESVSVTESGKVVPKMYSKLTANLELRKLNGITALTLGDGDNEFDRMGDQELLSELRRQATELGIDVELTYRISG